MPVVPFNPARRRALDRVRQIVLDRLAGHRARVYLFGSCARGDINRFSDIDVAIEPLETLPVGLIGHITEDLEESTIPYFVDVVDLSTAGQDFRNRIMKDAVLWRN